MQQESERFEQQINAINMQISELDELKEGLDLENKEILANIGKGIFVKANVKEKELFVNIGNNIVVKKNKEQTQEIIIEQILKLKQIKAQLLAAIEEVNHQLGHLIEQAR